MVRFSRLAARANYPVARVANLLKRRPQYGANERGLDRTDVSQMRYVRITDVDSAGRLVPGLGATAEVADNRYLLNDADILLARSGNTAGKSYMYSVADGPAIFAGYMIRFAFDPSKIVPAFAFIYTQLPVYHLWVQATRRLTGQPNINAEEYRSLTIPIPPVDVQRQVIAQFQRAMTAYNQAEAEAAALLASIDDYLLSELGIVLPPETENTLANRTFRVSAHELGGWRFDPYHHQTCFHKFDDALQGGKHPLSSLRNAYRALVNGYDCRDFVEDGLPYLKVAQVKPFNLKIEDAQAIPVSGVPARGLALMGDLLLTRKGTYGDAALNRSDTPFAFSSEVFRIRLNPSKLNGDYAEAVLNSVLVRTQFKRHSIGAIMGSLSQSIFGKIQIPLPPIDEQQRIAEYCQIIRGHAKVLEAKATAELETAKREIEAILLGSP
jgi:type I restriction enzyme S subunit